MYCNGRAGVCPSLSLLSSCQASLHRRHSSIQLHPLHSHTLNTLHSTHCTQRTTLHNPQVAMLGWALIPFTRPATSNAVTTFQMSHNPAQSSTSSPAAALCRCCVPTAFTSSRVVVHPCHRCCSRSMVQKYEQLDRRAMHAPAVHSAHVVSTAIQITAGGQLSPA